MKTLEIIEEMQANPALAEELRAVVLSRELLAVPERLASIDERLDKLVEVSKQHEARLAGIDERLAGIDERLDKLVEISRHHDNVLGRHDRKLSQLTGGYFENQWRVNAGAYLGSRGFRKVKVLDKSTFADFLNDLCDQERLKESDRNDILALDSIVSVLRNSDKATVYIACEIASRIHLDDVERVSRRSAMLEAATGTVCLKLAAGASIDDHADELAKREDVLVVTPHEWSESAA